MEPHLERHGVQVQRDHVHYAGGGASSIMLLAMLLLGLMKKCAWNILREALVCCSGGAFLIQRPLNKLAFSVREDKYKTHDVMQALIVHKACVEGDMKGFFQ